jgi:hypothetical protein
MRVSLKSMQVKVMSTWEREWICAAGMHPSWATWLAFATDELHAMPVAQADMTTAETEVIIYSCRKWNFTSIFYTFLLILIKFGKKDSHKILESDCDKIFTRFPWNFLTQSE